VNGIGERHAYVFCEAERRDPTPALLIRQLTAEALTARIDGPGKR
jgi:hypothetical protein